VKTMGRTAILMLATIAAAACAPPRSRSLSEAEQLKAAFANQYETKAVTLLEPAILAAASNLAQRHGSTLTLALSNGGNVDLRDDSSGCPGPTVVQLVNERCYGYNLMAYLPSEHFFIVRLSEYEGDEILLLDDRTGRKTIVAAAPYFSPDHARLLVLDNNEANGHAGLAQIWSRNNDGAEIEWQHQFDSEPCDLVGWTDKGIDLDVTLGQDRGFDMHYLARLTRAGADWHLATYAPARRNPTAATP